MMTHRTLLPALVVGVLACLLPCLVNATETRKPLPPDFDRDVRPILAENCFACHGFDANKRHANLRLDTPEGAYAALASGEHPIVPGKPQNSAVIERVTAQGVLHMPPANSGKKLTSAQINTLRRWIASGGQYRPHWAFVPPRRTALPAVRNTRWVVNPIDRFILARLESERLTPSMEADRRTLLRRVTLDLTGLPPTPVEVNRFIADKSPDAYTRVVDRLLASAHYGERMALPWLDLARYADTHGFHIDSQRDMWRWREWVINAFNRNMPYDQFVVQQLAGDLLPNSTLDQKIASGFNRNHPINFEGGAIPEEYQTAYIVDRIDTTATTFMGLTMKCAQCHDHKYDPIRQRDYYRFYGFFNSIAEQGLDGQKGNAVPYLKAPSPEQQTLADAYTKKLAELKQAKEARLLATAEAQQAWLNDAGRTLNAANLTVGLRARLPLDEAKGDQIQDASHTQLAGIIQGKSDWTDGKLGGALRFDGTNYVDLGQSIAFERTDRFSYGAWVFPTGQGAMTVLSRMDDKNSFRGFDLYLSEGKVYAHMIHMWDTNALRVNTKDPITMSAWHHLFVTYDGSSKAKGLHIYVDGKPANLDITHDTLTDSIKTAVPLVLGRRTPGAPFQGKIDEVRIYNRELAPADVEQLVTSDTLRPLLDLPAERRTKEQQGVLAQYYLEHIDAPYEALAHDEADTRAKQAELENAIPTTMVMQELEKPRETYILMRGQYDQHGEKVTPGTPEFLPGLPAGAPANRLSLARWLVAPTHPLTARVAVNRFWMMVFGTGIVKTAEDFGTQGERPSHPALLDWLATEFVRSGWNIKAMMRLIVTSATYRQSSHVSPTQLERDPENRLLARGPRFRLPAEFVRDQALAVSGLLVPKIGGPSVKVYQPSGLWEELSFKGGFSAQFYEQDHGESLYRRSMYTFWKRTVPPPSLQTFDAPEREFCMVRRSVTNTPLQALVLLNDPTYVEAARKFAERLMMECKPGPESRLRYAFELAVARPPRAEEAKILNTLFIEQWNRFRHDPAAAQKLLHVGEAKPDSKLNAPELAAWTTITSVILNLDETITKS